MVSVACEWRRAHRNPGMTRLVSAWLEAGEYIRNNPDAAAAITADRLLLTGEEVAAIWLERGWLEAWQPDLTDARLSMLEAYAGYMVGAGTWPRPPTSATGSTAAG